MTTEPAPLSSAPSGAAVPPGGLRRFSVAEYHRLTRDGYFADDDRFELLDGYITRKMPKDPIHEAVVQLCRNSLERLLGPGMHVRTGSPITLTDSEPEPDLSVVRGDALDFLDRHPEPADLALVVEVANTTLNSDRSYKGSIYMREGVLVYWIINIAGRVIEVFDISAGQSTSRTITPLIYDVAQRVTCPWDATKSVPVMEILPESLRQKQG